MRSMNAKTRKGKILALAMVAALVFSVTLPMMPASAAAPTPPLNVPTAVNGRVLTPDKTGDIANWVEIAQYGNYSLIVRASYLNLSGYRYGDPASQFVLYGTNNKYLESNARNRINYWFAGVQAAPFFDDVLFSGARLRNYTVRSNAINALGTCNLAMSLFDGLSLPTGGLASVGSDVAFALSYSECANFLSTNHVQWYFYYSLNQPSNYFAILNAQKIRIPNPDPKQYFMWLRSPGDYVNLAGDLRNEGNGRFSVYQQNIYETNSRGLIYPALWVSNEIFGSTVSTYDVTYYPNGGIGTVNRFPTTINATHSVRSQGYTNGALTFIGWNTEANGSGVMYQNGDLINVTRNINLYAQWRSVPSASVVYHSNNSINEEYIDYGNGGTFTIRTNMFTPESISRLFGGWNTSPDGRGANLPTGLTFSNFIGTLHLYAIWLIM